MLPAFVPYGAGRWAGWALGGRWRIPADSGGRWADAALPAVILAQGGVIVGERDESGRDRLFAGCYSATHLAPPVQSFFGLGQTHEVFAFILSSAPRTENFKSVYATTSSPLRLSFLVKKRPIE